MTMQNSLLPDTGLGLKEYQDARHRTFNEGSFNDYSEAESLVSIFDSIQASIFSQLPSSLFTGTTGTYGTPAAMARRIIDLIETHSAHARLRDFLEAAQFGVRGDTLAAHINRSPADQYYECIRNPNRNHADRWWFKRKGNASRRQIDLGWWTAEHRGRTGGTSTQALYRDFYHLPWAIIQSNAVIFYLFIGYRDGDYLDANDVSLTTPTPRLGLRETNGGIRISRNGEYQEVLQYYFAQPSYPTYAWLASGALQRRSAAGAAVQNITNLPPLSASRDTELSQRSGNFGGAYSTAQWSTVLPWGGTTPTPPTEPEPPSGPSVGTVVRFEYEIFEIPTLGTNEMQIAQNNDGADQEISKFWVRKTEWIAQGEGNADVPRRRPMVGTEATAGSMAMDAANLNYPYRDNSDGQGSDVRSGWPIVTTPAEILMAENNTPSQVWRVNVTTPASSVQVPGLSNTIRGAGGMAFHNGLLYLASWNNSTSRSRLDVIERAGNTESAVGTLTTRNIGDLHLGPSGKTVGTLISDGTDLIGINSDNREVYTIDVSNGSLTRIGTLPASMGTPAAAFENNGNLYLIPDTGTARGHLIQLNKTAPERSSDLGSIANYVSIRAATRDGDNIYLLNGAVTSRLFTLDIDSRTMTEVTGSFPRGFSSVGCMSVNNPRTEFYKPVLTGPTNTVIGGQTVATWVLKVDPGDQVYPQTSWPSIGLYDDLRVTLTYTEP